MKQEYQILFVLIVLIVAYVLTVCLIVFAILLEVQDRKRQKNQHKIFHEDVDLLLGVEHDEFGIYN